MFNESKYCKIFYFYKNINLVLWYLIHSRLYYKPSYQKLHILHTLHILVVVASTEYDKNLFCCLNFKLPSCSISKSRFSFLEVHKNADWFKSNKPFHYGLAIYTFSHNMCCSSWSLHHCKSGRKLLDKWFSSIYMHIPIYDGINIYLDVNLNYYVWSKFKDLNGTWKKDWE